MRRHVPAARGAEVELRAGMSMNEKRVRGQRAVEAGRVRQTAGRAGRRIMTIVRGRARAAQPASDACRAHGKWERTDTKRNADDDRAEGRVQGKHVRSVQGNEVFLGELRHQ